MSEHCKGCRCLLLCDLCGDRCHGALPGTESQRNEDPCENLADVTKERYGDLLLIRQISGRAKMHQNPEDDAHCEDDGTCLDQEGLGALPDVNQNASHGRYMVSRQLHDERSRIAGEVPGLL